ncbi:uncharacterized protein EI97DRAFT_462013 [Westerdykella ornata]|uniref:DUF8035 domain-containing protein n=1 Tax=Westerdykella ornata TaxID=318751 RepID=A0A6A6J7J5_WESOR|nr:uncharacterized protein EI97DRAFT_462013 [Westerdykella ornata]KAF2272365.1 hypothetical protein EI97DRAFT_462013 [Westerdykella ornata]
MSRRYPTAELYEERQRDFYRGRDRVDRSYDELDLELSRGTNPRRSAPDFFRDDYGRSSTAGQLVVRKREEDMSSTRSSRGGRREVEEDTLVIRGGRGGPPSPVSVREIDREDIKIRRSDGERRRPRDVERDETDVTIRHRSHSRPRVEVRDVERDDITFRRGDGSRPRRREVDFEREEVKFREREPARRDVDHEEYVFRHEHRDDSRHGRDTEYHKDTFVVRGRERSLPPPRSRGDLVAREREEFVIRRREPSPPPAPREVIKDEIIIRRKEERSPSPEPLPPPPPPPQPEIRPPIIQEIITHHRHIDHGVERARSPTPPPPPPTPPRDESLEISIRRKESRGGRGFEEDILFEREERKSREMDISHTRARSLSAPRRRATPSVDSDFESEADYYNRKAMERAYPGEGYNGATKHWTIVDVPPGTSRVRMDGIGGGAQEITWQRYNGVRRSKFISGDDERATDYGLPSPPPKKKDMWTEITKDLVVKEAIEIMGYDYEETDYFFYVMMYLRYEDVLQLVELSDDIRRRRKSRIREIEYEREEIRAPRPPSYDERFYEREFTYDSSRRRYR